jgi:hypothetical protein
MAAIGMLCALQLDASASDRFSIRRADAAVVDRSADARFAVRTVAEFRSSPADPPRFTLKSTNATCAPSPDPLFSNSFE